MAVYGGGFVDVVNNIVYEFELPLWGEDEHQLYSFDGENAGRDNGFKGKMDYSGKLWGIAGSLDPGPGIITPEVVWRAAIDTVTHVITLDIADLPPVNEEGDLPIPNQLTVDYLGNIYMPGGSALNMLNDPVIIKGVITELPVFSISWTIVGLNFGAADGTYCVALNPDHTRVSFYSHDPTPANCGMGVASTTVFTVLGWTALPDQLVATGIPYNFETDANPGSPNFGLTIFVIPVAGDFMAVGFTPMLGPGSTNDSQSVVIEEGDEPLTVDIDEDANNPYYYFAERKDNTPSDNIVNRFNPNEPTTLLTEVDQQLLAQPVKSPTHADTDRDSSQQNYFTGTALGTETDAFIREKEDYCAGAESDKAYREDYQIIFVGGRREPRYNPA